MYDNKNEFLIGELADICEVSPITLRYYDRIGILKPERICKGTNYRYYGKDQIFLVLMIKYCKHIGFTLKEIKSLLDRTDLDKMQKNFAKKLHEIEEDIQKSKRKYESINEWYQQLIEGQAYINSSAESKDNNIRIVDIPRLHVAISKVKITPDQTYGYFEPILVNTTVINTIEKHNLYCTGPYLLVYDNYLHRMEETCDEISIYFPIYNEAAKSDSISEFGSFKAVSIIHIGKYADIRLSYMNLIRWCNEHEISLKGSAIEKYTIDPWSTNNEQNYVTEILLPIMEN